MLAWGCIDDAAMTAVNFVDGDALTALQETIAVQFAKQYQQTTAVSS